MKYWFMISMVIGCTSSEPIDPIRPLSRVVLNPTETRKDLSSPAVKQEILSESSFKKSSPMRNDKPEADCAGLAAGPDPMAPSSKAAGRYGVGQMLGTEFIPLLYFATASGAINCSGGMEVRKWTGNGWVKI